jgi:hypothetical protein
VDKVIHCHCGFQARAEHEDGLVVEVQRHASEAHGMALTHDEALQLAFRAGLDRDDAGAQTRQRGRPRPSDNLISDFEEEE